VVGEDDDVRIGRTLRETRIGLHQQRFKLEVMRAYGLALRAIHHQGFHGQAITFPRRLQDRPDPVRLEVRFDRFERAAA
jgi:hypothetical protein